MQFPYLFIHMALLFSDQATFLFDVYIGVYKGYMLVLGFTFVCLWVCCMLIKWLLYCRLPTCVIVMFLFFVICLLVNCI